MQGGVLVVPNAAKTLYVPVFHGGRETAYAILSDAMAGWTPPGKADPFFDRLDFYRHADRMGRDLTGSRLFLGPEFVPFAPDAVFCDALYVFTVDFAARKIVVVK